MEKELAFFYRALFDEETSNLHIVCDIVEKGCFVTSILKHEFKDFSQMVNYLLKLQRYYGDDVKVLLFRDDD